MKERERVPKPGGSDRTRPKPSSRPAPGTKAPSTTSRTKPAPGAPKASSSSSKSSSGAKPSSSATKSSSSTSKSSSSTSKSPSSRAPASTSRTTPASSSKPPASKSSSSRPPPTKSSSSRSTSKPPTDSSRAPKAASSSSSSKSRSSSKQDEKPLAGNARPPRGTTKDVRSNRTSSRTPGESRSPSKVDREARRGEKISSKSSSSSSRTAKDPDRGREERRRSDQKSKDRSSTSRSQKDTSVTKERDKGASVKSSSRSKRSKDEDSAKERSKGDHVKSSSRSKHSKDEEPPSERAPKEHREKPKERIKSSKSDRIKSSRTKDRSLTEHNVSRDESNDLQDSGVEGLKGPVISQNPLGSDMDTVDQNQNSLETMESGISLSSPRDLSEVDVEESISSKLVEVDEVQEADLGDEDEAMVDNEESFQDSHMETKFSEGASMSVTGETNQLQDEDDDDNDYYEEDFEDYESDFEDDDGDDDEDDDDMDDDEDDDSEAEDDSADEDSEEDSDVGEPDPNMADVLRAIQEENNFDRRLQRTVVFDEPETDEEPVQQPAQHEEPKIEPVLETYPTIKPEAAPQRPKTSRTFVNFAVAKKKQAASQLSSKMNTRGRMLLDMIQLDTVTVELLTLAPVSYEAYISSFGHSNRQQISIQTNEDALSEEVQTDEILKKDKWTQKPVHISIGTDERLPGPEDYLGVGGDMDPIGFTDSSSSNTGRLTSFLTSASQVMLALLEEELVWELESTTKTNDVSTTTDGLGFSHPPVPMGSNVQSLLEGRPTPFVQFCDSEPMMLLSGHGFRNVEEESEDMVKLNDSSLICVWWVQEPSRPQHLLSSRSLPTSATFSPGRPSLVLAGLEDGSLAAWDLREPLTLHTLQTEIDEVLWKVRVPSFITACNEVGDGEGSKIVSIQAVTSQEDMEMNNQGSFQVVTLSRDGRVTWWVVVRVPLVNAVGDILGGKKSGVNITKSNSAVVSPHLGASPWSRIALNRSATISVATMLYGEEVLSDAVLCHDLRLDAGDPSQLYVATGSGAVAHCSRHSSRMHPRAYLPEIEPGCEALCLAICPHDHRYILVGGSDGVVRLHSTASERPLTSWQSSPDSVPVVDLQWSPARPCVFYVLDANARLHIWDLSAGDIFPVLTVETGGLVGGTLSSFHIAPTKTTSHHPLHGIFANDQGELVLRQVSPEFCTHQLLEDYNTELERFTYYVNII